MSGRVTKAKGRKKGNAVVAKNFVNAIDDQDVWRPVVGRTAVQSLLAVNGSLNSQMSKTQNLTIPALGVPLRVGTLYDSDDCSLVPMSLWDDGELDNSVVVKPQPNTQYDFFYDDSKDSRMKILNIDGSFKTSFLLGLVKVNGAAKYLDSSCKTDNTCRIVLRYRTAVDFRKIPQKLLVPENITYKNVITHGAATHLVSAATYGAQVIIVFDRHFTSDENEVQVNADVQATVMAYFTGDINADLNNKQKQETSKISVKFYGDIQTDKTPGTLQECVDYCNNMTKLMGRRAENAIPLEVYLTPLCYLLPGGTGD